MLGDDRYRLWLGSLPSAAEAFRLRMEPDQVAAAVAEIRRVVAERRYPELVWSITESSRPRDLRGRLLALGCRPGESPQHEPDGTAMALVEPPAAAAVDVDVRPVETLDDYGASQEIQYEVFGFSEHQREVRRARREERYRANRETRVSERFLALVDGEPAATALAVYGERGGLLVGGATLPWARGRGAYRALVRARWDEAVARGTPALVVHAGAMSRPILERAGFVAVSALTVLEDPQ
jgi:hypothetical protein